MVLDEVSGAWNAHSLRVAQRTHWILICGDTEVEITICFVFFGHGTCMILCLSWFVATPSVRIIRSSIWVCGLSLAMELCRQKDWKAFSLSVFLLLVSLNVDVFLHVLQTQKQIEVLVGTMNHWRPQIGAPILNVRRTNDVLSLVVHLWDFVQDFFQGLVAFLSLLESNEFGHRFLRSLQSVLRALLGSLRSVICFTVFLSLFSSFSLFGTHSFPSFLSAHVSHFVFLLLAILGQVMTVVSLMR